MQTCSSYLEMLGMKIFTLKEKMAHPEQCRGDNASNTVNMHTPQIATLISCTEASGLIKMLFLFTLYFANDSVQVKFPPVGHEVHCHNLMLSLLYRSLDLLGLSTEAHQNS